MGSSGGRGGGRGRGGGGGGRGGRSQQRRDAEAAEIETLEAAIAAGAPAAGSSVLSAARKGSEARAAAAHAGSAFPPMAAARDFDHLPLSAATREGLRAAGYKALTAIQRAAVPHALAGRDVLGAAKTGSGKTLAFLVPAVEKLFRLRWGTEDGVGCLVVTPTRELAMQIFDTLRRAPRRARARAPLTRAQQVRQAAHAVRRYGDRREGRLFREGAGERCVRARSAPGLKTQRLPQT